MGTELLIFDVAATDVPVMVTGNDYPLRVGDTIVKMPEPKIRALKLEGLAESWVNRPSNTTLADLDLQLVARAKRGSGYPTLSDEDYLLKRRLADRRGRGIVLRRAAELLFVRDPDHAVRAGSCPRSKWMRCALASAYIKAATHASCARLWI